MQSAELDRTDADTVIGLFMHQVFITTVLVQERDEEEVGLNVKTRYPAR